MLFAAAAAAVIAVSSCSPGNEVPDTDVSVVTTAEDNTPPVVSGWFDYGSALYRRDKFEPGTAQSVSVDMAKNEIEGFQYLLTSDKDVDGLRCEVTALTDGNGHELTGTVNVVYYTYLINTDATHPRGFYPVAMLSIDDDFVGGTFDVAKNTCRTIYVSYKTDAETVPGTYTGTLTVTKNGENILSGDVSVRVRDIYYDEKTECLTLIGLGYDKEDPNELVPAGPDNAPPLGYQSASGEYDQERLMRYADFLLENRFCPGGLPLRDGMMTEDFELVRKYMDNPRYNSVQVDGRKGQRSTDLPAMYQMALENGWLDKCYFGFYDEPHEEWHLQYIIEQAEITKRYFPTTQIIDAFFMDLPSGGRNIIERMSDYTTVYCPKVQFFQGEIRESMLKMKAERGDKLFWYVCSGSTYDTINRLPCTPGTDKRLLFWMQYQQNIDGFLYWRATAWNRSDDVWADDYMYRMISNPPFPKPDSPGTDEGVMIYWHPLTGEPVSTIGFEAMRDGVEDFQLLKMCEAKFGREKVLGYVEQIVTDVNKFAQYRDGSTGILYGLRTQLFDLYESAE